MSWDLDLNRNSENLPGIDLFEITLFFDIRSFSQNRLLLKVYQTESHDSAKLNNPHKFKLHEKILLHCKQLSKWDWKKKNNLEKSSAAQQWNEMPLIWARQLLSQQAKIA